MCPFLSSLSLSVCVFCSSLAVVYSLFSLVESITDVAISWVPMYYEVKLVFFLWLQLPLTQGATILYKTYVEKWFLTHEEAIDSHVAWIGELGLDYVQKKSLRERLTSTNLS